VDEAQALRSAGATQRSGRREPGRFANLQRLWKHRRVLNHHAADSSAPNEPEDREVADDEGLRAEAGAAIRNLGHALVGHHAPPDLLTRIAASVNAHVGELDSYGLRVRPGEDMSNTNDWDETPDGSIMTSYPDRPISGAASPWGVDLVITRDGDGVIGRTTFRSAHEGAPGRVHGGVLAATFDDLFGFLNQLLEKRAFTGEITVRYEGPTPLNRPIELRARLVGLEGRKQFFEAEAFDGSTRFARSTATFIAVDSFKRSD
jgi:acyl-coenzyme A thioesterase PaaI-like protein